MGRKGRVLHFSGGEEGVGGGWIEEEVMRAVQWMQGSVGLRFVVVVEEVLVWSL